MEAAVGSAQTYTGFSQGDALLGVFTAHGRERNLRVQEEEPATDVGEGLGLAGPLRLTCSGAEAEPVDVLEDLSSGARSGLSITFEGSPDGDVSQGQGVSHQEGTQREGLVQLSQGPGQPGLTTQTLAAELQPVVHLPAPRR